MPLFGPNKKAALSPKEAIAKLRESLEILEKREEYLQKRCETEASKARNFMQQKNKRAALFCLKRKRVYEQQIEKLGGARMTIEQQIMTLESANVSVQTMNAMKEGVETMKQLHKEINIDKVDDIVNDIGEQMDIANEINEAISQPLGSGLSILDDEELLKELEEMEQTALDEQFMSVAPTSPIPSVAVISPAPDERRTVPRIFSGKLVQGPPKKRPISEEDELKMLEASMK